MMDSNIYSKNVNLSDDIKLDEDKKIIEILKKKNEDLLAKLNESLVKFYECEFRTMRAEQQKNDYWEIIQKKIEENKEIYEANENLENDMSALTQSLNFSKKEIERLDTENTLIKEQEETLLEKIELYMQKNSKLEKKVDDLESENGSFTLKFHEQKDQIEILQSTIDRYKSKVNPEKKENNSNIRGVKGENSGKSKEYILEQKVREQSEEIIKLQMQVIELKKRLSEDEKLRVNLFDVIKSKKQKNKNLKNEMDKIAIENEETGKENKWSHDMIMKKDNAIKLQKDKIEKLNSENNRLSKLLFKFNGIKKEEKGVETDGVYEDVYVRVNPSPTVFKMK